MQAEGDRSNDAEADRPRGVRTSQARDAFDYVAVIVSCCDRFTRVRWLGHARYEIGPQKPVPYPTKISTNVSTARKTQNRTAMRLLVG